MDKNCRWAVGDGDDCPNIATHLEYDSETGEPFLTCTSCCGASRENGVKCNESELEKQ
jgi:hypothetical protein